MDLKKIFENDYINEYVKLKGWVKSHRKQKDVNFIDFYDGTCFKSIQIVYNETLSNYEEVQKLLIGSAIEVEGTIIESEGIQDIELKSSVIGLLGDCDETFPLQAKGRPTREYLREIAYLRPRTNLFQAVFRVRSLLAFAIHKYFNENNYIYVHSPLITSNDGEGAGEMFKVTTLDLENLPNKDGKIDFSNDFFGKKVGLTVTGQLQGEAFAHAFKKIYTFGPTFRAEASHTKTHASEFWMIEPEIAFCDLNGLMDMEEEFLKYLIKYVLDNAKDEMKFFDKFIEPGIIERLTKVVNSTAARITHEEAINILLESKKSWEFIPKQGEDIATEHEKYLTEEYFNSPVFVTNWPKEIKAFYMRQNDDGKTVAAVDLLVPDAGELMGGSQREERYNILMDRMNELNINTEDMYWYLNLRKYGCTIHSGFGMGFERLLIYITGVDNIRDVIPFPRTPNNCDF